MSEGSVRFRPGIIQQGPIAWRARPPPASRLRKGQPATLERTFRRCAIRQRSRIMLGFPRPGKRPANALLLGELGLSSDDQPKTAGTAPGSSPSARRALPGSGRECLSLVREHLGVGESAVVVGVRPLSWTPERWRPKYRKPYPPEFRLRVPRTAALRWRAVPGRGRGHPGRNLHHEFSGSRRAANARNRAYAILRKLTARARRAASIERVRVHRRQSSCLWHKPVTPEVAGSSPVAP